MLAYRLLVHCSVLPGELESRLEHTVAALTLFGFVSGRQHYSRYVSSNDGQLLNLALKHFSTTANKTFHRTNLEATEPTSSATQCSAVALTYIRYSRITDDFHLDECGSSDHYPRITNADILQKMYVFRVMYCI